MSDRVFCLFCGYDLTIYPALRIMSHLESHCGKGGAELQSDLSKYQQFYKPKPVPEPRKEGDVQK